MQDSDADVLSTPGHLISLAARGFARLSEARLKPLGFGVGHLPVLVALKTAQADTQRDLARFAQMQQPPMAQMLTRMERDGLIHRTPDPRDGRSSHIALTERALARLPQAIATLFQGNRDALTGFTDEETEQLVALLGRLVTNLDRLTSANPPQHSPISTPTPDPA
ncbi:MAG TPA: MarR family transcriptional regulator [Rhodopila sp.]|jgi:DNA-binding MarR family transcriptional regulator|nr:MarR family transcriptional regulator [Rhodopila sp.]